MSNIKLSVIITFCNQDQYIINCLLKIFEKFRQSQIPFEIIVGIDGTTNFNLNKLSDAGIKDLSNFSILFLNSPSNLCSFSRASFNRSTLLRKSIGEFIMMLDGDDEYIEFPSEAINILNNNPIIGGVAYNYSVFNVKKNIIINNCPNYDNCEEIDFSKYILEGRYFHINASVLRRRLLEDINHLYLNDGTAQAHILSKAKMIFLDKPLMLYRVGISSIYAGESESVKKISNAIMYEEMARNLIEKKHLKIFCYKRLLAFVKRIKGKDFENCRTDKIFRQFYFQVCDRELFFSKLLLKICLINNAFYRKVLVRLVKVFMIIYVKYKIFLVRRN